MEMRIRQTFSTKQKFRIVNKIIQAEIIGLSEVKFAELVKEIEDDSLFKKLVLLNFENQKIISYNRFPRTDFSMRFLELCSEMDIDKSTVDIERFLNEHREAVAIIKKIGAEKFKKYFLYENVENSVENISRICEISEELVKKVIKIVDELVIFDEFYYRPDNKNITGFRYYKIAKIEKDKKAKFIINFLSPTYFKGKYIINYNKLKRIRELGIFDEKELKGIKELVKKLELINNKKFIIFQILNQLIIKQEKYFQSGNISDIIPLTQREIAKNIMQDESLVSRAILNRSIETPQNIEIPIKFLFQSEKDVRKRIIKEIIENTKNSLTDFQIKCILKDRHNIDISRRTIAVCRKEL
ncbi:MAG TPA: hypothetical protein DCP53_06325 [Elusimicrobia bacterium]|nr:hypothetical protein [Elusimicrobiota bacterium]